MTAFTRTWHWQVPILIIAFFAGPPSSWAGRGGGDVLPISELGVAFHTGETDKSLTGAFGYFLNLRAEGKKGYFRPNVAIELQSGVGKASLAGSEPNFTLYGSAFLVGFHFFLFPDGSFQPFVGGHGVAAWYYMKLTGAPADIEPQTQAMAYGYELSTGIDIRRREGTAIRLRGSLWNVQGTLAETSGFQLFAWRFTLGIVW